MANKVLVFDSEARQKLIKGIETLSRAVTATLGPKGNNVALDRTWGAPAVIHDGVSVSKDIDLTDNFENMGCKLVKQAAVQTGETVGDGTSTSILLADKLTSAGNELIEQGGNAMEIRKGMEVITPEILKMIDEKSIPVKSRDDLVRIATISAGNEEIGEKIADALDKVGEDGIVTVEEGQTTTIETEYKEGMQFDQGYLSIAFVNRGDYMDCVMDDVDVLISSRKLSTVKDIEGLDAYFSTGRKLLIIASEIDGIALETLVMTRVKAGVPLCIVRAPGFGEQQQQVLDDIAYMTGGIVISPESGRTLEKLSPDLNEFGHADKIQVTRDFCRIIGGGGSKDAIETRITQLKEQIKNSNSDYDKSKLSERLAKLTGGVAVIKVGAPSESEMKEKYERAKDAVEATKAAMAEGIVAGGGITLLNIGRSEALQRMIESEKRKYVAAGMNIVRNVLYEPILKLLENAGYNEDNRKQMVYNQLRKDGIGYNIETGEKVEMVKLGIIDPTKVTKTAFKNAVSVASSILTTCCLVTDVPEDIKVKDDPMYG